jgi:hypothetical protein
MDNQLKDKTNYKFETTYLFDYFKHEKLSTLPLVLFISTNEWAKLMYLTIDVLTRVLCTNSSFDWWYLLLNSVQIIPFRKNLILF